MVSKVDSNYSYMNDKNYILEPGVHFEECKFVPELNTKCVPDPELSLEEYASKIIVPKVEDLGKRLPRSVLDYHPVHDIGFCVRNLVYSWMNLPEQPRTRVDISFLNMGHRFQAQIATELNFGGFLVDLEREFKIENFTRFEGPGFVGHVDMVISDPQQVLNDESVSLHPDIIRDRKEKGVYVRVPAEIKAVKSRSYTYYGRDGPSLGNYDQLQMQLQGMGVGYGYLVYVNRDTMDRVWFRVFHNPDRVQSLMKKANFVYWNFLEKEIPQRAYQTGDWQCKVCKRNIHCWGKMIYRESRGGGSSRLSSKGKKVDKRTVGGRKSKGDDTWGGVPIKRLDGIGKRTKEGEE